jgi:hypothetical protein
MPGKLREGGIDACVIQFTQLRRFALLLHRYQQSLEDILKTVGLAFSLCKEKRLASRTYLTSGPDRAHLSVLNMASRT